jgi:uncharacterized protein DUF2017
VSDWWRSKREKSDAVTRGFRRTPRGVEASFDTMQAGVLRRLATDIEALIDQREAEQPDTAPAPPPDADPFESLFADFTAGATSRPDDPVLARLLPDGYAEPVSGAGTGAGPGSEPDDGFDAEAASADFRRFTEGELRNGKATNARTVRDCLPPDGGAVLLDDDAAAAWLGGLNDMRLALGTALEVGPDTDREYARLDPMSSRARRLYLYFWLGVLQETLIDAITEA